MNDYPIILVHGIIVKEFLFFKAFGGIEKRLKKAGSSVFTADTDGFGTIENNAAQLKAFTEKILAETGAEKVHFIAHSKGGLDGVYCQSFSSAIESCKDDFLLSIPLLLSRHCKEGESDGIVTVGSSRFADYRGNCLNEKASHSEIIGLSRNKKKRERVYEFYIGLCEELLEMNQ